MGAGGTQPFVNEVTPQRHDWDISFGFRFVCKPESDHRGQSRTIACFNFNVRLCGTDPYSSTIRTHSIRLTAGNDLEILGVDLRGVGRAGYVVRRLKFDQGLPERLPCGRIE
jgi:hypothetical protein